MISQKVFDQFVRDVLNGKFKNIAVVSHNDLDGMGAIVTAKHFFGDTIVQWYNASYNGVNKLVWRVLLDKEHPVDALLITDISINDEKLIKYVTDETRPIFLFDHHETAKPLNKFKWATVSETSTCGTKLFWEHCIEAFPLEYHTDELQDFVELVNDYDTWAWAENGNQDAVDLSIFASTVGQSFFMKAMLAENKFQIGEDNMLIVNTQREKLKYVLVPSAKRNIREVELCIPVLGNAAQVTYVKCGVVVVGGEQMSLVSEELKNEYDTLVLITTTYMSLRTKRDDIDMSAFAAMYGGGGHAKSAGCNVTNENYYILETYWKNLLNIQ